MNTLTLLSDAKYFDEGNSRFAEMRTLLDSKHSKEKLEAMKRLMAMITIGRDVSSFFPDVVKNIVVESQGQSDQSGRCRWRRSGRGARAGG